MRPDGRLELFWCQHERSEGSLARYARGFSLVAAATAQGKSRNPEDGLSLSALREKDASADFRLTVDAGVSPCRPPRRRLGCGTVGAESGGDHDRE